MTELERKINELLDSLVPTSKTGAVFSMVKKTLNSSSKIVDTVNNIGDSLQENIEDGVGGVTGAVGGWIAGKTSKLIGGVAGGVVAGTLKTVAGIIPDSSDAKSPETDRKLAHCIDTHPMPYDKQELFELLQFTWTNVNSNNSPYGKQTKEAFKNALPRVQNAFTSFVKEDKELLHMAQPYLPKKRFGLL